MSAIAKLQSTKILVVHDHLAMRSHIRRRLEASGYEVVEAYTCMQAIGLIEASDFSVIVINADAPDYSDASPLCIRNETVNFSTPCILLATNHKLQKIEKGFNPKLDDHILKPFRTDELVKHIDKLLQAYASSATTTLGAMTICRKSSSVTIKTLTTSLPKKQIQVLLTLALHAPRVVTRELLLDALEVKEPSDTHIQSIIRPVIYRLRKNLNSLGSDIRIKTVRGYGYRVKATKHN